jgi:hypothetical protein
MADTVRLVLRIVRDQRSPELVASAQTAWLVRKVLLVLAQKDGDHDTLLRIPEAKFATWASRVREGFRQDDRSEKQ